VNRQERRRQRKQLQKTGESPSGISPKVATSTQLDNATELYAAGRLDEAAELCQDAIAGAPLDGEAFHLLALIRYRQGRLQDAGENILEAITRNDTDPEIHANCGAIMNMLGRHPEAEAACRHVIGLKPKNAEAHSNLAVALEMQGRLDEAREACEEALRLNPEYLEARINLGNLDVRQGDYVSGVEAYAKAIQLAPENPTARANFSVALLRLGETGEAIEQARQALALSPQYVEALNALGNALSANGEYGPAEEAFRKAYAIQPAHREAGMNLAATLHKSGRSADALTTYRGLLESAPNLAEAENGLGVVLLAQGKTDDAIDAFRRALAINSGLADAYYNLASSGDDLSEKEVTEIKTLLDNPGINAQQQICLHFTLAELADRRGDPDEAMSHLNTGNGLRTEEYSRNEIMFEADDLDREIAAISEVFSKKQISALQGLGNSSDSPVFICGMPRSGTTLVEQIISSHPAASSVGELGVVGGLMPDFPNGLIDLNTNRAGEFCQHVLEQMDFGTNIVKRVIDKSPFNFFHLGLIQILFPNAHVIHCRRDPLDVGLSCYAQNFIANHPWSTDLINIGRYIQAENRMMEHWSSVLNLATLDVRYENLVADQKSESQRIIEFLGLDWDETCLRFYENDQTVLTASNWQVRKPLYSSSVGKANAYDKHLHALKAMLSG